MPRFERAEISYTPQSGRLRQNGSRIAAISERAENLSNFVREELEQYRKGIINRISTNRELMVRFAFNGKSTIPAILQRYKLNTERKLIVKDIRLRDPDFFRGKRRHSKRYEDFVTFVKNSLEKFKSEQISYFPSSRELSIQFGYSVGTIIGYLHLLGISNELKTMERRKWSEIITPSRELAWMMGILASGGYVKDNCIGLNIKNNEQLLKAFLSNGERIFKINGRYYEKRHVVEFHNSNLAKSLGDFRNTEWPHTFEEKHSWTVKEDKYRWSFLEGYFETKGTVSNKNGERRIGFGTTYPDVANFLIDLLLNVGAENPEFKGSSVKVGKNLRDIKLVVENIHSIAPDLEEKLRFFRETELVRIVPQPVYSYEEMIREWKKITGLLGRSPTITEAERLRKEGKIEFSGQLFSKRFGGGSFVRARENLERIIRERGEAGRTAGITETIIPPNQEVSIVPPQQ